MSVTSGKAQKAKSDVKKAAYSPTYEAIARFGFGVRGALYIIMGVLALQLVIGRGGQLASPTDAIAELGKQPGGKLLLWAVLVGLAAYASWGLVRAILDPLHKGTDLKGIVLRLGFVWSAFGYAILIPPTLDIIRGRGTGGSSSQQFISKIMSMPWGRWALIVFGMIGVIGGFYQIYMGIKSHFDRQFSAYELTHEQLKLAILVARFGTIARGIVFGVIGVLIVIAAYRSNPSQNVNFDAGLAAILNLPFGIWLLGIIAVGLIAFGAYSMMSAFWFRLRKQAGGMQK